MTQNGNGRVSFYRGSFVKGEFIRPETRFRKWVRRDGSTPFLPEPGRYHLYVSLACPWSHRVVLLRSLRKLENVISMSVTDPIWNENGWFFGHEPGAIPDAVNGKRDVIDLYRLADPSFSEEETVPILWDKKTRTIVNNESRDLMRMLDHEFSELGDRAVNLCSPEICGEVDRALDRMYGSVNDGVYRAGFAETQSAYEEAFRELFSALDEWEARLSRSRFVCGDRLTEADVALFVTLFRFDSVYYSHFKCNLRRVVDYPNLWGWLRDVYQLPGAAGTCNMSHIKKHYYGSHRELNPSGIVPLGPELDFLGDPGRGGGGSRIEIRF